MARSVTAVPRPHRTHDEKGIYPSHMLPPSPTPVRAERSTMAPFGPQEDPYASHRHYRSPVHSSPNLSATSSNSAGSPPSSLPQSPTRQVHNVSHVYGHGHGRHHSLSTDVYVATDCASTNGAELLPRQPTKRHTQQYISPHSELGAVGPEQNIPPVLPQQTDASVRSSHRLEGDYGHIMPQDTLTQVAGPNSPLEHKFGGSLDANKKLNINLDDAENWYEQNNAAFRDIHEQLPPNLEDDTEARDPYALVQKHCRAGRPSHGQ